MICPLDSSTFHRVSHAESLNRHDLQERYPSLPSCHIKLDNEVLLKFLFTDKKKIARCLCRCADSKKGFVLSQALVWGVLLNAQHKVHPIVGTGLEGDPEIQNKLWCSSRGPTGLLGNMALKELVIKLEGKSFEGLGLRILRYLNFLWCRHRSSCVEANRFSLTLELQICLMLQPDNEPGWGIQDGWIDKNKESTKTRKERSFPLQYPHRQGVCEWTNVTDNERQKVGDHHRTHRTYPVKQEGLVEIHPNSTWRDFSLLLQTLSFAVCDWRTQGSPHSIMVYRKRIPLQRAIW